ncbi:intercellular adhesion molecule 5 L homeolog isoform X1 [Xenopus laevis]|uniref:Intercellular adhesion molecule 5 L homeolog isoform X1 n=1 Tax=Xenopus laevis TaxID=8355 RepID=A0A8J1MHZ2_XENLA|nr:intercellular adhesion molecule 5 L homeolog isoform X1 [Xenopus laevis]
MKSHLFTFTMDIPCLRVLAAFCLLSVYQVNTFLLTPVLQLEDKIIDDESTDITCMLPTNETLDVDLKIVARENFSDCRNKKGPPPQTICKLDPTSKVHGMEVTCEAHFVAKSKTKIIYVHNKPKILEMEVVPPAPVPEGEKVTLTCKAEGNPPPAYKWETPPAAFQSSPDNRTITIQGVKREHYGTYRCRVQNKYGEAVQIQNMSQPVMPKIQRFEVVPLPPLSKGANVTLTCDAEGLPIPTYTWETPASDITFSPDNRTISIQGIMQTHRGNYTCVAHNKYGTDTQRKIITISGTNRGEKTEPVFATILLMLVPAIFMYCVY